MKVRTRKRRPLTNARRAPNPLKRDPSRTATLRRALVAELRRRFARLKGRIVKLVLEEDALGLRETAHDPFAANAAACPADRLLAVPDVRQPNRYACGASASAAVGGYWRVGPRTVAEWEKALGTTVELSTHPKAIVDMFRSLGCQVEERDGMSVEDLAAFVARGWPVICPVQDWGRRREAGASFLYGHYLSVVGIGFGNSAVVCQDSSIENVERVPGGDVPKSQASDDQNIALPGKVIIGRAEWERVWHDRDIHGTPFVRYGIAVGPPAGAAPTENTRWMFATSPEKVKAFQSWLSTQIGDTLTGDDARALWEEYARRGFAQGAGRAFDDVRQSRLRADHPELFTPEAQQSLQDFYAGSKDEFLRSAFGRPVAVEKVQLLAGRSFDDLENVTGDMSTRMSRALTDGLVEGKSPHEIAGDLTDQVDIGRDRAEMIARTELIRAHAAGQLQALADLGVEEVGVAVEFTGTDDDKICPQCEALEGIVLKLDEAENVIPVHPG